ncbi:MAG: hypothetical protein ABSB50_12245 [Terracidiphilus sp.]
MRWAFCIFRAQLKAVNCDRASGHVGNHVTPTAFACIWRGGSLMSLSIDNVFWLAATLTEALVIALLFKRRMWRTLPLFCSYCVWDLSSNLTVYAIGLYKPAIYFSAYLAQTAIDSAFVICVLIELAWSVLRPVRASLPRSALALVGILILVGGAVIWPFAAQPGLVHATSSVGLLLPQLQHTVSILRILFFLALAGGSQLLSIGWRDRELQVATGLGFYSIVSLAISMIQAHQTTASQVLQLNQFVVASYIVSLVYWVFSFAQQEAERREFTPQMRSFLLAVAGAARSTRVSLTGSHSDKPSEHDKN